MSLYALGLEVGVNVLSYNTWLRHGIKVRQVQSNVSYLRSSIISMDGGRLLPVPPLGKGISDGTVDIADYEGQPWPKVPVAIPSKGRETELCHQTLRMLRSYEYDMSKVHVFVDATHVRIDG